MQIPQNHLRVQMLPQHSPKHMCHHQQLMLPITCQLPTKSTVAQLKYAFAPTLAEHKKISNLPSNTYDKHILPPNRRHSHSRNLKIWLDAINKNLLRKQTREMKLTLHWKDPVAGFCSQIRTVLSAPHEAIMAGTPATPAAGFHATRRTLSVCPRRVSISTSSEFWSVKFILQRLEIKWWDLIQKKSNKTPQNGEIRRADQKWRWRGLHSKWVTASSARQTFHIYTCILCHVFSCNSFIYTLILN